MIGNMKRIPEAKLTALESNIYSQAHWSVGDWHDFDWHKSQSGEVDSDVLQSSQAFCISVWGSLFRHSSSLDSSSIRKSADLDDDWAFLDSETTPEFEFSDRTLLDELNTPQPTSIDVLLEFDEVVVTVESKLTEALGSCSQPKNKACSGMYMEGSDLKTGTDAPCRLQIQDGRRTPRRYWDVMTDICGPGFVQLGKPCPFAGPSYQVMRNIATASALAERKGKDWRAIFAFPGAADDKTSQVVDGVASLLSPSESWKVAVLDYDRLAADLASSSSVDERNLATYMSPRLALDRP